MEQNGLPPVKQQGKRPATVGRDSPLVHWGDIAAIPGFALLAFYFWTLDHRTDLETLLLAFSIAGFVADCYFTLVYLRVIRG